MPPPGDPTLNLHTRRVGGTRRNVSARVAFFRDGRELSGWALNISRGGLRAIVEEERVDAGADIELVIGDDETPRLTGRIVWAQNEPDGTIVGIEFREPLPELPPNLVPPNSRREAYAFNEAASDGAAGDPEPTER